MADRGRLTRHLAILPLFSPDASAGSYAHGDISPDEIVYGNVTKRVAYSLIPFTVARTTDTSRTLWYALS